MGRTHRLHRQKQRSHSGRQCLLPKEKTNGEHEQQGYDQPPTEEHRDKGINATLFHATTGKFLEPQVYKNKKN